MAQGASPTRWSVAEKFCFRFTFAYILLYNLPAPLGVIPGTGLHSSFLGSIWPRVVPWASRHILGLDREIVSSRTGSGDTFFDYVQLFCIVSLAIAAAAAWTAADRKRSDYRRLNEGLRVYARYALACAMISYGMDKIMLLQFPFPGPEKLAQPLGEFSPMGLLWAFMGSSATYSMFAGASEILGGLLLFMRRTTTLGAIVCAGVMLNVVMLNFSYDVPVKIYSSNLLLLSVFLLVPELPRLTSFFLLDRPVPAAGSVVPDRPRWLALSRAALKAVFVAYMLGSLARMGFAIRRKESSAPTGSPPNSKRHYVLVERGFHWVNEFPFNR